MKATQSTINDFFALTGTIFSIPVYQRNYTWEEENCEKLLQDIVSISQNKKTHFMGSITYILHLIDDEKSLRQLQEFVIIDGQQRVTTIMLLLKAIETKIQNEGIKKEINNLLNLSGQRLRLKPIKSDKEAFDLVMQNRSHELQGVSHIRNNYKFFTKELEHYISKGYRIEEIYGAFLRLKIVAIGLELGEDDPQVVFESINATGVQLKGLDLIRNYLMMGENSDNQNRLYNTYWVPLEDWLGEKDLNDFIKTYLRIYFEDKVKEGEREVYYTLKAHHRDNFPNDIQGLMSDMREYGRIYQIFLDRDHLLERGDSQQLANLRLRIKDLVKIKFGVAKPFVLRCARDFEEGKLDYENFHEILQILISYFVRRSVCGDSTGALNKVLYSLYGQLGENVSADALKRYLGKSVGQMAFPNDDKIKTAFAVRNAYSANQAYKFILLEIEKLSNAEPPKEENLEVEHFYPKTPTQEWRDMVGDYFTFEQDYLNNFGNLTLSGQNQKLGNKPYEAKIELMEQYSSLHLNDYFINNTHSWGIEEVKARSEYLADQFCQVELFKDLPKEYRTREISKTLDDDLTSHNLQSVKLPNHQRKTARNAKELANAVIDYLLENAREAFENYTDEAQRYICWDKAKAQLKDRDGTLVVPFEKYGFYFVSSASYQTVGNNLRDLILGCDLNPRDFIVE
ncbi:rloF [Helicobacter pylori]|nr:rloF [Helicobacter pylori]